MDTNESIEKLKADIESVNENFVYEYDRLVYKLVDEDLVDGTEAIELLKDTYIALTDFSDILNTKSKNLEKLLKGLLN
tara:strand:+ start:4070 stop:4303 length:234 start_codon:yes stop_codon:yes gene_type:complete